MKPASSSSADCAARLAVLADPTRLGVVAVLLAGPRNVTQINQHLRVAQNLLSHHLRVLREAGLVVCQREGKAMRYTLAPGVEVGPSGKAISLGCCDLNFKRRGAGRKES